jgi:hypothetical protein
MEAPLRGSDDARLKDEWDWNLGDLLSRKLTFLAVLSVYSPILSLVSFLSALILTLILLLFPL